jgi:hypothetical protein
MQHRWLDCLQASVDRSSHILAGSTRGAQQWVTIASAADKCSARSTALAHSPPRSAIGPLASRGRPLAASMASQVVASSSTAALQRQAGIARLLVAVRPSAGSRRGGQQQQRRRGAALRCAAAAAAAGGAQGVALLGVGSSVPEKFLTNEDMAKLVETSDEWITSRTGIRKRHILAEGESLAGHAATAAQRALEMAGACCCCCCRGAAGVAAAALCNFRRAW